MTKPDISIHFDGHDPIEMTGEQFDRVASRLNTPSGDQLKAYLDRIDRLDQER